MLSACPSQHTSAYRLCIRQHTSAYRLCTQALSACPNPFRQKAAGESFFCRCSRCWVTFVLFLVWAHTAPTTHLRQHTSASSAYVSIRQHSSDLSVDLFPNVSIRQHTSAYVSIQLPSSLTSEYLIVSVHRARTTHLALRGCSGWGCHALGGGGGSVICLSER